MFNVRYSMNQILLCLALNSPNSPTPSPITPASQPFYSWNIPSSFQPQDLCTCYSFSVERSSPDIPMAAPLNSGLRSSERP